MIQNNNNNKDVNFDIFDMGMNTLSINKQLTVLVWSIQTDVSLCIVLLFWQQWLSMLYGDWRACSSFWTNPTILGSMLDSPVFWNILLMSLMAVLINKNIEYNDESF